MCVSGERGLVGPPGEKPTIPIVMKLEMKGVKGDPGEEGLKGFVGPRGKPAFLNWVLADPQTFQVLAPSPICYNIISTI